MAAFNVGVEAQNSTLMAAPCRMSQLADSMAICDWATDVWKVLQYIQMIQKGISESFCKIWKISPRVRQYFLEIG